MLALFLLAFADVAPAPVAVPNKDATLEERFDYAARCRVHSDLLPTLANSPAMAVSAVAIRDYWYKESDRLAKKLGHAGEGLTMRYLLYPVTANRELLISCAENAKGVFKK